MEFRIFPGSLPSLFSRSSASTASTASARSHASETPDAADALAATRAARETLASPKQAGFLSRLLGRHNAKWVPSVATATSHATDAAATRAPAPQVAASPRQFTGPAHQAMVGPAVQPAIKPTIQPAITPTLQGPLQPTFRPPILKLAPPQNAASFRSHFPTTRLDELQKQFARRGVMGWLRPKQPHFSQVIDAARRLHASPAQETHHNALQLQRAIDAYLTPEKFERWQKRSLKAIKSGKKPEPDAKKQKATLDMRLEVSRLLAQRAERSTRLEQLNTHMTRRIATQEHAAFLALHGGVSTAQAGSSEVRLIRAQDQTVAYAFKPALGESTQNFVPVGGAALREKLCSLFNDEVLKTTGLNFGFPAVEITSLEGDYGALIEGVPGRNMDVDALAMKMEASDEGMSILDKTRQLWNLQVGRIEPRELQKIMLANLAMGNVDIKWGNLMMDKRGHCRPIDGGSAFPTRSALASISANGFPPDALCDTPAGGPLPTGDIPIDGQLREQFLSIDPKALTSHLLRQRRQMLETLPPGFITATGTQDREMLLDENAVQAAIRSLEITQRVLRETPDCSMRILAERYLAKLQASVPDADVAAFQKVADSHSSSTPAKLASFVAAFDREAKRAANAA